MNAVVWLVLACVSIVTVKTIKRIPINLFYQGDPDKTNNSEDLTETDSAEDETTVSVDDDINAVISDKNINGDMKFTDFILEAAKVLKTYEKYDLEQAFVVIDYEVWENMYEGCKSHELADIRRYVSDQLGLLKDDPADILRQHLDYIIEIIRNEDYGEVRDMVDFVNSLYVGEHERFIEMLLALVHKRISVDVDLADLIKYALKSLIFDHYCNLDDSVRRELIKMIKHYWNQFSQAKVGRGKDTLSLVTPFIYEKRNEQIYKKRRFNTVNEGRSMYRQDFEYSEDQSAKKMRANSAEISHTHHNPKTCSENKCHETKMNQVDIESTKEEPNKNDFVMSNNTAVVNGGGEILKTPIIDDMKENLFRYYPIPSPEESIKDAMRSGTFKSWHSNKTIDKLIKIGTLAKEINDMMAIKGKALRYDQNALSWNSIFGTQMSTVFGDYGDLSIIPPDSVKADEGNGKKDILISMKAKYEE